MLKYQYMESINHDLPDKILPILVEYCEVDGYILFPTENNNDNIISEIERLELHEIYTKIFSITQNNLIKRYEEIFKCNENISKEVVLRTLPDLLKVFFESTVRVKKAIDNSQHSLSVVKIQHVDKHISTVDGFLDKVKHDPDFNAELIYMIGRMFNLQHSKVSVNYDKPISHHKTFINNNSRLYKRNILNGLFARAKQVYFSIRNYFFTPVIGIINASYLNSVFVARGWYGKLFKKISLDVTAIEKEKNLIMRNDIFKYEDFDNIEIDMLLDKMNLNKNEKIRYKESIVSYLIDLYPKNSLEMFLDNIDTAKKNMNIFDFDCILTGSSTGFESLYFLCLARERNIKIFRLQHGGYSGYRKLSYYRDYLWNWEYALCDEYLTWGWSNDYVEMFVPFVSPWLSGRKLFWNKNLSIVSKKYDFDIVIAPTRLQKYTSVGNVNTVDDIFQRSNDLVNIVLNLSVKNIRILYKSPSIASSRSYSNSIEKMKKIGGNNFFIMSNIDKGLTLELLESAPIILWDVVGTGFLECMASDIPTVVYINNYSLYEDYMVAMLKKLEKVGIVHRDTKSISFIVNQYKNNMGDWFSDIERKKCIKEFTNLFCNTSDCWDDELIAKINLLGSHNDHKLNL